MTWNDDVKLTIFQGILAHRHGFLCWKAYFHALFCWLWTPLTRADLIPDPHATRDLLFDLYVYNLMSSRYRQYFHPLLAQGKHYHSQRTEMLTCSKQGLLMKYKQKSPTVLIEIKFQSSHEPTPNSFAKGRTTQTSITNNLDIALISL